MFWAGLATGMVVSFFIVGMLLWGLFTLPPNFLPW
ncbi:hypothetical protein vBRpoSV10_193 [Ruegeria phage vB_RpoS-V10]|nr:hypothetical protein vBRpoSV10_193 [Ruegeria phage vB_RpoS-V10]